MFPEGGKTGHRLLKWNVWDIPPMRTMYFVVMFRSASDLPRVPRSVPLSQGAVSVAATGDDDRNASHAAGGTTALAVVSAVQSAMDFWYTRSV